MNIRVITPDGFGRVASLPEYGRASGKKEYPDGSLGESFIRPAEEVFEFGEFLVARVVAAPGTRTVSNILPFRSLIDACSFFSGALPEGEIRVLINLAVGKFDMRAKNHLGFGLQYLRLSTWIDRWGSESANALSDPQAFDEWAKDCPGTDGGIYAPVLLDFDSMSVVRFLVVVPPPAGVVYSRKF